MNQNRTSREYINEDGDVLVYRGARVKGVPIRDRYPEIQGPRYQAKKYTELTIPVRPVPASRPRVTRFGTYFSKNYEDFRNECYTFLSKIKKQYPQTQSKYIVEIEFICRKPKNPANEYPIGDCDNFLKGPLDALTKVGMFWHDDVQVIDLRGTKRYQNDGEAFGMNLKITEIL